MTRSIPITALLLALAPSAARAAAPPLVPAPAQFAIISCLDAVAGAADPVFADLGFAGGPYRFEMGNIEPAMPGQRYKKILTNGNAAPMMSAGGGGLTFIGNFGFQLSLDARTGAGLISGLVDQRNPSGSYDSVRIANHPVRCALTPFPQAMRLR